jgi:SAM-dependent methyltransferase
MSGHQPDNIASDGSPILVYRRLPPGDAEADLIAANVPPGAHVLELGAGAGRVTHALMARGLRVTAVDDSAEMLAAIHGAETVLASIEGLALGRRFDAVILGSHLVNTTDDAQRGAFLRAARDHVYQHGSVLLEHHASEWAQTATEGESRAGDVTIALREVRRHPPFVSAVAEYRVDGHVFRQPFTARVWSAEELAAELRAAGFAEVASLTPCCTLARLTSEPR